MSGRTKSARRGWRWWQTKTFTTRKHLTIILKKEFDAENKLKQLQLETYYDYLKKMKSTYKTNNNGHNKKTLKIIYNRIKYKLEKHRHHLPVEQRGDVDDFR